MEECRHELKRYLELYGSEFRRWPVYISPEVQKSIITMPEYLESMEIDAVLDSVSWPEPSTDLFSKIEKSVNEISEPKEKKWSILFVSALQKPTVLASMFAFCMAIGLSVGIELNNQNYNYINYTRYFSTGPAGVCGGTMEGIKNE